MGRPWAQHSKREKLFTIVDHLGLSRALLLLRRRFRGSWLTVVNYHRVSEPEAASAFDDGVLDATPESLDRQVRILKEYFTVIGLEELLGHLRGRPLPPNPALITFDDGYRDCHDRALPILRAHGVKGVFFIATDFVTRRRIYWWDHIGWLVKHARNPRFVLEYPSPLAVDLEAGRTEALNTLLKVVKTHEGLDLERYLAQLRDASGAPWDAAQEARAVEELIMTWDQVRALRDAGMDVGSHTRTHRVLQTLDPQALEDELVGSRADLERELREPVLALAYPVGRPVAHLPAIRKAIEAAGYLLGFTYPTGIQSLASLDPLDMRRLGMEFTYSDRQFRGMLATPQLT